MQIFLSEQGWQQAQALPDDLLLYSTVDDFKVHLYPTNSLVYCTA